MKITTSLQLATLVATFALSSAFAQTASALLAEDSGGLLGQTYTGVEFGYTHHVESAPRILRRYGLVSHQPLGELGPHVDAAFRYDYTRGSAFGATAHQHDVTASLLRYWVNGTAKPFVHADLGWAWQKFGGVTDNSFLYRVGAGMELGLKPRMALTPFVNYRETRSFDDRVWNFGAKFGYRVNRQWSSTFTLQMDDAHNLEYALGVQRRF